MIWHMASCWLCGFAMPFDDPGKRSDWVTAHAAAEHPTTGQIRLEIEGRQHLTETVIAVWDERR